MSEELCHDKPRFRGGGEICWGCQSWYVKPNELCNVCGLPKKPWQEKQPMSKAYLTLTLNRESKKKPIVVMTPQVEIAETAEELDTLEAALKAGVESMIVQLKYTLNARKERVCPGCHRKDAH